MSGLIVGFGVLGAAIGTALLQLPGLLFGFVIGALLGWVKALSDRIAALEKQIAGTEGITSGARAEPLAKATTDNVQKKPACPADSAPPPWTPRAPAAASAKKSEIPPAPSPSENTRETASGGAVMDSDGFARLSGLLRNFFTQGNTVVRIGLIVLFFGMAFLIKYAAERELMPIELRLAAVALAGLVMLFFGWRLRDNRSAYALLIQGGGVGILYLTIFGAARLYDLLPLGFAFALMLAIVVLSALLALLQEAPALAVFGSIGGFLAPVLIATGTGSHVLLFSYYALINAGIVGIAWFKSWRVLNWVGFVFTFGIGLVWGYRFYQAEFFQSTEPFLILFFLFYIAISILFAHRQPVHLKGYIDGSLVFGLPVIAFGLQSGLVYEYTYGMAISALFLGGLYIALASLLWRRQVEGMRLLTESFLSLGVVFTSIAIPLGLDSHWTTGLWCLEGAGLVWIGLRQHRVLARFSGLLLQAGAGLSFLGTFTASHGSLPLLNNIYMSTFLISLSGGISSYCHQGYRNRLKHWELPMHAILLAWALVWWLFGGLHEIDSHLGYPDAAFAGVVFIAASGWGFGEISRRLQWTGIGYPAMAGVPVAAAMALLLHAIGLAHPFVSWGAAAWGVVAISGYHLLYRFDQKWPDQVVRGLHLVLLVFIIFILTWGLSHATGRLAGGTGAWAFAAWGLFPTLAMACLIRWGRLINWPIRRYENQYRGEGLIPTALFLMGWALTACFKTADPSPLAYLPVVNPLEIVQLLILLTLIQWRMELAKQPAGILAELPPHLPGWLMLAAVFLWLNSVIARTVHFWAHINFSGPALFESVYFQSALSVAWPLVALVLMAGAAHRKTRPPWVVGAVLLGAVVAKLFLIDLAGIGTVARIVSFLAVGILMLVIGYISPLPPKQIEVAV